jgi:hypothetical protein
MCLLALLVVVAILSLRVADCGVARADDPVPTYYFSAVLGTAPPLATCWVVDTGLTQGSYHIFKVINVLGNPEHSEQRIRGFGPDGYGDYIMGILVPAGDDPLAIGYFYVSGL